MIRTTTLLIAMLAILYIGCRKGGAAGPEIPPPDTCTWKKLTSIKTRNGGEGKISYNADGTIKGATYFNNGQLMVYTGPGCEVVLDSIGRLQYLKQFGDGSWETRYYFYDDQNRVVKTLTHTGNGINYIAALTYENGDVVEFALGHDSIGPNSSRFKYTYYDTLCVDQYLGIGSWMQIGQTQNKHLLKTSRYDDYPDSTHYSYVLDSNNRVLVSYRNYDNSGWYYERATDTTWYGYSCK